MAKKQQITKSSFPNLYARTSNYRIESNRNKLVKVVTFDCTSNPATVDKARHNFMPKCIGSDEKMKVLFTHVED